MCRRAVKKSIVNLSEGMVLQPISLRVILKELCGFSTLVPPNRDNCAIFSMCESRYIWMSLYFVLKGRQEHATKIPRKISSLLPNPEQIWCRAMFLSKFKMCRLQFPEFPSQPSEYWELKSTHFKAELS